MLPSENCYRFIADEEKCRLKAYPDTAGVPTIGFGNTFYEDGTPVKLTDAITRDRAVDLFRHIVNGFAKDVFEWIDSPINQNQFDALVSFAYNVGLGAFGVSTLLKRVDANPFDPRIRSEFAKWNKAGGRKSKGLENRRRREANLYFKPVA